MSELTSCTRPNRNPSFATGGQRVARMVRGRGVGADPDYLLKFPGASPPSIALIGTIGTSTTYLVGFLSGVLSDRWGYRITSCAGTALMTLALILASFSKKLWQLYFSQGLLFGIGSSLVYFAAVSAPSHWFGKRRGLAMGLAASGSGLGGFFLAPLTQYLIDR
ncbi:hypothetical protein BGZ74_010143, partial [Mortierella antarctica]